MTQLPHRVPRKLGKKLFPTDPYSEKSPRIHQITPKLGCYLENSWVFANARARSGDSAPRGQGGGSPPCTSCLLCLQKLSPEANYFPPLGTLCPVYPGTHCGRMYQILRRHFDVYVIFYINERNNLYFWMFRRAPEIMVQLRYTFPF